MKTQIATKKSYTNYDHTYLINYIIQQMTYKSYLEIGVYDGINFNNIKCEHKECCDPMLCDVKCQCKVDYKMTSDEMFEQMLNDKKFDIIFIDGMHIEEYVDRDIMNSMKHLTKNGVICLHDTIPANSHYIKEFNEFPFTEDNLLVPWQGTVFKSIVKLYNNNILYYTINNSDAGLTVIFNKENFDINLRELHCPYEYEDLFIDGQQMTILGKIYMHEIFPENFFKLLNQIALN